MVNQTYPVDKIEVTQILKLAVYKASKKLFQKIQWKKILKNPWKSPWKIQWKKIWKNPWKSPSKILQKNSNKMYPTRVTANLIISLILCQINKNLIFLKILPVRLTKKLACSPKSLAIQCFVLFRMSKLQICIVCILEWTKTFPTY